MDVRLSDDRAVEVTYRDGRRRSAPVPEDDYSVPRDWGLDEQQAEAKFTRLAAPVIGAEAAEGLRAALLSTETHRPVRSLWREVLT